MIRHYAPTQNSLGVRIKNIINSDYLYISKFNNSTYQFNNDLLFMKKLIIATEKYIFELEKIQANCTDKDLFC